MRSFVRKKGDQQSKVVGLAVAWEQLSQGVTLPPRPLKACFPGIKVTRVWGFQAAMRRAHSGAWGLLAARVGRGGRWDHGSLPHLP